MVNEPIALVEQHKGKRTQLCDVSDAALVLAAWRRPGGQSYFLRAIRRIQGQVPPHGRQVGLPAQYIACELKRRVDSWTVSAK